MFNRSSSSSQPQLSSTKSKASRHLNCHPSQPFHSMKFSSTPFLPMKSSMLKQNSHQFSVAHQLKRIGLSLRKKKSTTKPLDDMNSYNNYLSRTEVALSG
ncbi:hypothetical protein EJF18_20412 [Clavispora lusitaniae]|uniref:Uncharacterized protein n=1 Tax=Clavispora lusitaniae TaxID=36911 RepID=A0ACD0WG41_CLALS|nr:hypothetical protein EJF14_20412 [Clavispora lusitaniae]QFZ32175.1 hypothetical protein EJF16_20412 [Clavispora lusitaniae]QFZ37844.1 hypothetical protein EJF15_20412 [Clavispora lusitaniae]QFZ43527.1 hypothetical protein EJF18_20412 [Clavispora lusitaniae]QFZ49204.1 hypothetical protein EJF17_20412 [Clavispora lusitaniae]